MQDESSLEGDSGPWLSSGVSTACGPRSANEDAHLLVENWNASFGIQVALFAVCDGHGGSHVAQYVTERLSDYLGSEFEAFDTKQQEGRRNAVERAFLALDASLQHERSLDARNCGSTCVAAIAWRMQLSQSGGTSDYSSEVAPYKVLFANLGDSRGLMCRPGVGLIVETIDHKPDLPSEKTRIVHAGGCVKHGLQDVPRLDGDLAMSRAFGDFRFKDDESRPLASQRLSPLPQIIETDAQCGDMVVLACDGVFDVLRSSKVSSLVLQYVASDTFKDMTQASEIVVEAALRRTRDNVTCIVVRLGSPAG